MEFSVWSFKMTISISPTWWDHLQVVPLTPWWSKLELTILPHLASRFLATSCWVYRIWNNEQILTFKVSKQPYWSLLHDRIIASGANVSLVAKNGTKKIIPLQWIKSSKKPQIKKFHKTDTPQKWEFWFKIQFGNFQKPEIKLKKTP